MSSSAASQQSSIVLQSTIEDVVTTFVFAPNCQIEGFLPGGKRELQKPFSYSLNYRLTKVNGIVIADSGELKEVLLQLSASVKGNAKITVAFESTLTHSARVPIEKSVLFDGDVSATKKVDDGAVREMVDQLHSPPPHPSSQEALDLTSPRDDTGMNKSMASEASSVEFDTVQLHQLHSRSNSSCPPSTASTDGKHGSTTPSSKSNAPPQQTPPASGLPASLHDLENASPELLEFEKMKLSMRDDTCRQLAEAALRRDPGESTVKGRLLRAIEKVQVGGCVICITQEMNPIAEIELLAMSQQRQVVSLDLGVKLRLRPKPDVVSVRFKEAMRTGSWFVMVNAQKSISTCTLISDLITEAQSRNYEGFDPKSKIIISLEPHPHFPRRLIQNSHVVKLVSNLQGSSIFSDSMATSQSRNRLVTADALSASVRHGEVLQTKPVDTTATVQRKVKKTVKIAAAVDIVDIAPREVVKAVKKDSPIDVSGSVVLFKTFSGVLNDKFLCVRSAGEAGRFAVGSSFGNVYFLDCLGNSLLQAHAHNASIWDVSFMDKYHFATGCEDGTSASWSLGNGEEPTAETPLLPTSATSLGADVYCVSYLRSQRATSRSPLLIGGLHSSLVVRAPDSDEVVLVPISSNAQVVDTLPSFPVALVGGGDGSVTAIDVPRGQSIAVWGEHTRKLPSLTVRDDNHFFTGSFDSSILSWDLRVPGGVVGSADPSSSSAAAPPYTATAQTKHTLKLKNYVTGLDVDEVHLAASVGRIYICGMYENSIRCWAVIHKDGEGCLAVLRWSPTRTWSSPPLQMDAYGFGTLYKK